MFTKYKTKGFWWDLRMSLKTERLLMSRRFWMHYEKRSVLGETWNALKRFFFAFFKGDILECIKSRTFEARFLESTKKQNVLGEIWESVKKQNVFGELFESIKNRTFWVRFRHAWTRFLGRQYGSVGASKLHLNPSIRRGEKTKTKTFWGDFFFVFWSHDALSPASDLSYRIPGVNQRERRATSMYNFEIK